MELESRQLHRQAAELSRRWRAANHFAKLLGPLSSSLRCKKCRFAPGLFIDEVIYRTTKLRNRLILEQLAE